MNVNFNRIDSLPEKKREKKINHLRKEQTIRCNKNVVLFIFFLKK